MLGCGLVLAVLSTATQWAHEEFTNFTQRIFGSVPDVAFVLPGGAADFKADFEAVRGTDGYAVRLCGKTLTFIADNPRGHVNGVHRWLERNSDVIWPRPAGDLCIYTPRKADLGDFETSYVDIPAFKLRYHGGYSSSGRDFRRYCVRNGATAMVDAATVSGEGARDAERVGALGTFFDIYGGGHDMETKWFPVKEFYGKHPEFWALVDGERKPLRDPVHGYSLSQFCESNPKFAEAFAKSVEGKIAGLPPTAGAISINIEDSVKTCQCPECNRPITLPDGTVVKPNDPAYKSTRFFLFFNKVARHVARIRPGLKILQYAYVHLSVPPKVPVERNIILKFCPYPRNMRESVFEGPSNRMWRERADGWLANTPSLYWREYYFCQCVYYPRPICDTAALDLRAVRKRGVQYVYTDAAGYLDTPAATNRISIYSIRQPYSEHYDMCGMEVWAMQKLFWNPDLDPESLRAEFLRRTFGPAAADVGEFYRALRDSWYSETMPSCYNDESYRCAANFIVAKGVGDRCRRALLQAEAHADTEVRRKWIRSMIGILDRWIADAPNYLIDPVTVQTVRLRTEDLDFDFDHGGWAKAAKLPALATMRRKDEADSLGNAVRVLADGKAFLVAFDVRTPGGRTFNRKPIPPRNFPIGERIELQFSSPVDGYYHFVFDPDGNKYDARMRDCGWRASWDVRTMRTDGGWKAVVRIPFETIGFNPHLRPNVRFLPLIALYGSEGAKCRLVSWGGGVPHEPDGWGELTVKTGGEE